MARMSQAAMVNFMSRPRPKRRKASSSKKPRRLEHSIQSKALVALAPLLRDDVHVYAIPNGGYRLASEAVRLKSEGVRKGIADLVFLAPMKFVGFLEMKTAKGPLSDEQVGFRSICIRHGHPWGMARSVEEAIEVVRVWGLLR